MMRVKSSAPRLDGSWRPGRSGFGSDQVGPQGLTEPSPCVEACKFELEAQGSRKLLHHGLHSRNGDLLQSPGRPTTRSRSSGR